MPRFVSSRFICSLIAVTALYGCSKQESSQESSSSVSETSASTALWPSVQSEVKKDPAIEARILELLGKMSLEQKVGQLIQPELRHVTPQDITQYSLGSILNGGGSFPNENKYASVQDWLVLGDSFYKASMSEEGGRVAIPVIWGTDAVHGHNNIIGATIFPHNIGLGAARNPDLMRQIGQVTSAEIAVTGIDWSFAPTLAVVRDDRWGRTYESYSENPEIVQSYAGKMVEGLQGAANTADFLSEKHVFATAKHFLGDGGTQNGVDRGDAVISEEELVAIHNPGYITALQAGAQTVMASFSSWNGEKMHGNQYLLTNVLKERMGFDGFVVGDWNGHAFVPGCTATSCPQAINAGLDIFMAPDPNWKELYTNTLAQAKSGEISEARLNDAVSRILRVKLRAGLFERGAPSTRDFAGKREIIGSAEHRAVARQAVRESLVLLKNNGQVLPVKANAKILVAGDGADNIGKQSGGWSITWQGTGNTNADFPGGSSIFQGISDAVKAAGGSVELSADGTYKNKPDVAFVVFGENPYAEMQGDINKLVYTNKQDLELLKKLKADGIKVVALFITGRPLWANTYVNAADAFAVIWLPGSEGAGVADVVLTKSDGSVNHDFKGKLSFSWPSDPMQTPLNVGQSDYQPLFAYGYGLTYAEPKELAALTETIIANDAQIAEVYPIFNQRPVAPWQLVLLDNLNNMTLVTTSKAEVSTVSVAAVDNKVQEDARRAVWNGSGKGILSFGASQRVDLTAYADQKTALVFDFKVNQTPGDAVSVGMYCGADCETFIDVTDAIKSAAEGEWASLAIPLECYGSKRVKMDMVMAPFAIATQGKLDITLYNIRIEKSDKAIACPAQ